MRGRGSLRWSGAKPRWPRGPVQWVLVVIAAVLSFGFVAAVTRTSEFSFLLFANVAYFGSLILLSVFYRVAERRRGS